LELKPLVIAERFHFYRRVQGASESVADFVAALRQFFLDSVTKIRIHYFQQSNAGRNYFARRVPPVSSCSFTGIKV